METRLIKARRADLALSDLLAIHKAAGRRNWQPSIKGEFELTLRREDTGEIIEKRLVKNVETRWIWSFLVSVNANYNSPGPYIVISNDDAPQHVLQHVRRHTFYNGGSQVKSSSSSNQVSNIWTFYTQFAAPSSGYDRTVRYVGLCYWEGHSAPGGGYADYNHGMMCGTVLSEPIIQTGPPAAVSLEVLYRLLLGLTL
jgi:hypothetical protein